MVAFGKTCVACPVEVQAKAAMQPWLALLGDALASPGGLDGASARSGREAVRRYSAPPSVYGPVPERDEQFQDLWIRGVNPEAFIYDPGFRACLKTLMMLFKRLREIDALEVMASIIHETKGKPREYNRDVLRRLWGEARHALMGEVGFFALGVDWTRARVIHN